MNTQNTFAESEENWEDSNLDEGELSYAEILASAILNGEIVITIPIEEEEKVKQGIKNYKSKQAKKMQTEGLPVDASTLAFSSSVSKDFTGCIELHIAAKSRSTVKVKRMRILQNDFPD